MKVVIAFLLCVLMQTCYAGKWHKSIDDKKLDDLANEATNACVQEMNRGSRKSDSCNVLADPNILVCVNKKLGLMNQDGTYNLERLLSFTKTEKERQEVLDNFNSKMNECPTKAGNDPCKWVACAYGLSESKCGKEPKEDDGC